MRAWSVLLAGMLLAGCSSGSKGEQGPVGPTGPAGPQGIQGAAGAQGIQGIQGIQGLPGSPGLEGPQGLPGSTGLTGPQGPSGVVRVLRQIGSFQTIIPAVNSPITICETAPYLAGSGETAVIRTQVNCPVLTGQALYFAAAFSIDGGQDFPIGAFWATTNYAAGTAWHLAGQDQVLTLGAGASYTFSMLLSNNSPSPYSSEVFCGCSTVVQVVRE